MARTATSPRSKIVRKRVLGHKKKPKKALAEVQLQNLGQNWGAYENAALNREHNT